MSEFTAALGLVQIERLPEIVAWKNEVARARARPGVPEPAELPDGMVSGLYKYIVFDWLERSTGPRLRRAVPPDHGPPTSSCPIPTGSRDNHSCVPLYYRPTGAESRDESPRHRRIGLHRLARRRQAARARPRAGDLRPAPVAVAPSTAPSTPCSARSPTARRSSARSHSCDAVAHLAAVADVNDVHAEPEDAERVNARGTVTVLEAARRAGVKRIVYASTIWVYSDCEADAVDEDTLLPAPSHLYTSTKLAGELYCKAYQELYGIDYTILRFGIPYGPRAREAAVIPAFVNKAFARRAADARRRRQPVAAVRLRRGPRRRRRARARRRRRATASTTSPATRT